MAVKGDSGHGRRTQAERSASTRGALLAAARELFAAQGFAGTGREEIVERAGVTRGALYHHFASKEEVFRAVYEQIEDELTAAIATAAMAAEGPMEMLRVGSAAFLEAASRPEVRRVVLLDAPSVLPVAVRRELSERHGLGLIRDALLVAMDTGALERRPVEPLAHMLLAAMHEAATMIADGADRAEVGAEVDRLLENL